MPPTDSPEIATGTIQGVVTSDELVPIANATVRVSELNVVLLTTLDGTFEITGIPPGKYVVEIQAPGYAGQSNKVEVAPGVDASTRFVLRPLAVVEPRVEVVQHTTVIHHSGGPGLSQLGGYVPGMCSDNCSWATVLPARPDLFLVEVGGRHSTPHPRGWDGLRLNVYGHPLNSTNFQILYSCAGSITSNPNDPCLRLPYRVGFNGSVLAAENNLSLGELGRIRLTYWCEDTWVCLEDRYETYLSAFYDWEREEIPPDYSAMPGG